MANGLRIGGETTYFISLAIIGRNSITALTDDETVRTLAAGSSASEASLNSRGIAVQVFNASIRETLRNAPIVRVGRLFIMDEAYAVGGGRS